MKGFFVVARYLCFALFHAQVHSLCDIFMAFMPEVSKLIPAFLKLNIKIVIFYTLSGYSNNYIGIFNLENLAFTDYRTGYWTDSQHVTFDERMIGIS